MESTLVKTIEVLAGDHGIASDAARAIALRESFALSAPADSNYRVIAVRAALPGEGEPESGAGSDLREALVVLTSGACLRLEISIDESATLEAIHGRLHALASAAASTLTPASLEPDGVHDLLDRLEGRFPDPVAVRGLAALIVADHARGLVRAVIAEARHAAEPPGLAAMLDDHGLEVADANLALIMPQQAQDAIWRRLAEHPGVVGDALVDSEAFDLLAAGVPAEVIVRHFAGEAAEGADPECLRRLLGLGWRASSLGLSPLAYRLGVRLPPAWLPEPGDAEGAELFLSILARCRRIAAAFAARDEAAAGAGEEDLILRMLLGAGAGLGDFLDFRPQRVDPDAVSAYVGALSRELVAPALETDWGYYEPDDVAAVIGPALAASRGFAGMLGLAEAWRRARGRFLSKLSESGLLDYEPRWTWTDQAGSLSVRGATLEPVQSLEALLEVAAALDEGLLEEIEACIAARRGVLVLREGGEAVAALVVALPLTEAALQGVPAEEVVVRAVGGDEARVLRATELLGRLLEALYAQSRQEDLQSLDQRAAAYAEHSLAELAVLAGPPQALFADREALALAHDFHASLLGVDPARYTPQALGRALINGLIKPPTRH
ncbi:hypothetical protein J2T57_001431 [Natronocella acetinitrilica]|uniref:Uncharacterized protein n=1 Tax=Natronocella acetinitrilica TaxID=414046 RepID=A0AAE3KB36_9GAMM|nr:hypothetical protein [Natronocella acetinitrilica]